jgi:hypothetical protein
MQRQHIKALHNLEADLTAPNLSILPHVSHRHDRGIRDMNALQPSFMLLPNFSFLPDRDLHLGTILTSVKGSKLPDPKRPLNKSTRREISPSDVQTQEFKPWSWDSSKHTSTGGGLHADVPLLTGIGSSFTKSAAKGNSLMIRCDSMIVSSFRPDIRYLAQTVQDEVVKAIAQKLFGPPLYMIVGLMTAVGAQIVVSQDRNHEFASGLGVDGTPLGVPLTVGPSAERSHSSSFNLVGTTTEPFLLAYEIVRIRMKRDGTVKEQDENKWALFNDEEPGDHEESDIADFERDWTANPVTLEEIMTWD